MVDVQWRTQDFKVGYAQAKIYLGFYLLVVLWVYALLADPVTMIWVVCSVHECAYQQMRLGNECCCAEWMAECFCGPVDPPLGQ
jgi:hypothetical protein